MKTPTGWVRKLRRGVYEAGITYTGPDKKRHERTARFESRDDAERQRQTWWNQWRQYGTINDGRRFSMSRSSGPAERRTVADLVTYYEKSYAVPPVYRDGRKIAGQRSYETTRGHLRRMKELECIFLDELSWGDIDRMRLNLIQLDVAPGKPGKRKPTPTKRRSIAGINRILGTLRRMLAVARQMKWMTHNPFKEGDQLIQKAHEVAKVRFVTDAEEAAMIAACEARACNHKCDHKRKHGPACKNVGDPTRCDRCIELRALRRTLGRAILIGIETGMRENEIVKLQRCRGVYEQVNAGNGKTEPAELPYVDFDRKVIVVTSMSAKTLTSRVVPITQRLYNELVKWCANMPPDVMAIVKTRPTTSWNSVRKECGLQGVGFHALRHTFGTRACGRYKIPLATVARIMGHKDVKTTMIYVNLDEQGAREVAETIDAARPEQVETPKVEAVM